MGNVDNKCKHSAGYMYLSTTKPMYYPGEYVEGTIFMRVDLPIPVQHVLLEVKGKEKGVFTRREKHGEHWRHIKYKTKTQFLKFNAPCFQFGEPVLQPGDYAFPFIFQVPMGLPSSLIYKNTKVEAKPKAKVKYTVKTILQGPAGASHMSFKKVLIVRETPPALVQNFEQTGEKNIKSCCCLNQGISRIKVQFDKNIYEPTETMRVKVHLDNKTCNSRLQNVTLKVEQKLEIRTRCHTYREQLAVAQSLLDGVNAREEADKEILLDLRTVKFESFATKKRKGQVLDISPEDKFMMSNMQANSNAHSITNQYFMTVQASFESMQCCGVPLNATFPITVLPVVYVEPVAMVQPPDFEPVQQQVFQFQVAQVKEELPV